MEPTRCWPRPSSTSASTPWPRRSSIWPTPAFPFVLFDGTVPVVSASRGKQPITMLSDRVMVQIPRAEGERKSRSGILIPATADVSKRLAWAEVMAIGPHVRSVATGDLVLFNPEDRYEVEVQGEDYVILRERDIHAVASERIDSGTGLYL